MKLLRSLVWALFLACSVCVPPQSYAQTSFESFSSRIEVINENLETAFRALYNDRDFVRIRLGQRLGSFATNTFRRVGLGPEEPSGLLVRPVSRAHRLMFEIAVDEELTDEQKDQLLDRLADRWQATIGEFLDDYVDPMDRRLLSAHLNIPVGENVVAKAFSHLARFSVKYGTRLFWGLATIPRDVGTSLIPASRPPEHGSNRGASFYTDQTQAPYRFQTPRAMPIFGADTIRSQNGVAIGSDIRHSYNKALSAAKNRHRARVGEIKSQNKDKQTEKELISKSKDQLIRDKADVRIALMRLHHESRELEPIRDGDLHALAMTSYDITLVVVSVFFAQIFAVEPTLTGAFWWTALVWVPVFKGLLQNLRRNNSGYGFFRRMRFLRYPEAGFIGRMGLRARFFFEKLKTAFSDSCEFQMEPIARIERSFVEARRAAGQP